MFEIIFLSACVQLGPKPRMQKGEGCVRQSIASVKIVEQSYHESDMIQKKTINYQIQQIK